MSSKNSYDVALSEIILALHTLTSNQPALNGDGDTIINTLDSKLKAVLGIDDVVNSEGAKILVPCTMKVTRLSNPADTYEVSVETNKRSETNEFILSTFETGDRILNGPVTQTISDPVGKWFNVMLSPEGEILIDSSVNLFELFPSKTLFKGCAPIATILVEDVGDTPYNLDTERLDNDGIKLWNWTIVGKEFLPDVEYIHLTDPSEYFPEATTLTWSTPTQTGFSLSWDAVDSDYYELQYVVNAGTFYNINTVVGIGTTINTQVEGNIWKARVRAVKNNIPGDWSNIVYPISLPATPTNISFSFNSPLLVVDWDNANGADSYEYGMGGGMAAGGTVSSSTKTFNIGAGTGDFNFSVRSINAFGESPYGTATYNVPVPIPVLSLFSSNVTSDSYSLSWTSAPVGSYDIEWKVEGDLLWNYAARGNDTTTYDLDGLVIGEIYESRVRVNIGDGGELGEWSSIRTTELKPGTPTNFVFNYDNPTVTFDWDDMLNATDYEWEITSGTGVSAWSGTETESTATINTTTTGNITVRVRSRNAIGYSGYNTQVFYVDATVPYTSNFRIDEFTWDNFDALWNAWDDLISGEFKFRLKGETVWEFTDYIDYPSGGISLRKGSGTYGPGQIYEFSLHQNIGLGDELPEEIIEATVGEFPAAVLTLSGETEDSILVGWDSLPAIDTLVQYKETANSTWLPLADQNWPEEETLSGLTADTSYDFRARFHTDTHDGPWSATETTSTLATPAVISIPTFSIVNVEYISLQIVIDPNTVPILARKYYRKTGDTTWISWYTTIPVLDYGTEYELYVSADDEAGTVLDSTILTATTKAAPPIVATIDQGTFADFAINQISPVSLADFIVEYDDEHKREYLDYTNLSATPYTWLVQEPKTITIRSTQSIDGITMPIDYGITGIDVIDKTLLESITINNNAIATFDVSAYPAGCRVIDLTGNVLPVVEVNNILVQLDANGASTNWIDLDGQTPPAPPSGVGITAVSNLLAKNWSVTTD